MGLIVSDSFVTVEPIERDRVVEITGVWRADEGMRESIVNVVTHIMNAHVMHCDVINRCPEAFRVGLMYEWEGCGIRFNINQYALIGSKIETVAQEEVRVVKALNAEAGVDIQECVTEHKEWILNCFTHVSHVWMHLDRAVWYFVSHGSNGTFIQMTVGE